MRKVDLNDEKGRHNPFIIRDPCKIFSMSQVKEYMIEKDRESIRTTSLAQRADILKPPVPTGAASQRNTRSITSYTSMKSTTSNFNSDVLRNTGRITDFIRQKREIYKIQLLIDQKRKEINSIYKTMENEEKKWEDKDKEIDNLGVKYKCISVKADNLYVDQKNAFEQARSNAIQLQATLLMKKRDIIDLKEEYKKDLLTLQEYQGYQSFLQQFVPKGKNMFDHFNDVKQIETELANEQKENLFLITNCIELESQINNCQNNYEQSLKNIEKLILNIKPIIEETYDNSDEALMKAQYKNEFNNKGKEIEKITAQVRKIYDQFFEHDDHMKASTMLNKVNAGLEDLYNRAALLDQKYMNQQQKEINKIRREQQRADQMMQKELVAQVKKEQALERANKPIVRRTGRPLVARSFIPKVIKNNDEELRLKALAERRQTEMLFGKYE